MHKDFTKSFQGRKLIGIVAAAQNTKVLRVPLEVYQNVLRPYHSNQLNFLHKDNFETFIFN